MSARLKTPCRGRKRRTCRKASRSCMYIAGPKRRYCRKHTRKSK